LVAERDLWFRVLDQIEGGKMPPKVKRNCARRTANR
jgi:hypothetical protein